MKTNEHTCSPVTSLVYYNLRPLAFSYSSQFDSTYLAVSTPEAELEDSEKMSMGSPCW